MGFVPVEVRLTQQGLQRFHRVAGTVVPSNTVGCLLHCNFAEAPMSKKPSTTLPGTVERIIKPLSADDPEKAQITVEGADHLYREIRIENTLTDENGEKVRLKPGAEVEVTVEAPPEATTPKSDNKKDKKD